MIAAKKYRQLQKTLIIVSAFLALYTFAVFVPLYRWVDSFNQPIEKNWKELLKKFPLNFQKGKVDLTPLLMSINHLENVNSNLLFIQKAVIAQTSCSYETLEKMKQSFQLVDYQNERQLRQEELQAAASTNGVAIYPGVLSSYPEYSSDLKIPELLWAHLSFVHEALMTAIDCRVASINSLSVQRPTRISSLETRTNVFPIELSFRVTVSGNSQSVIKFISILPVKAGPEIKDVRVRPTKPELYLEKIMIKKDGIEELDLVLAELKICGFVFWTSKTL